VSDVRSVFLAADFTRAVAPTYLLYQIWAGKDLTGFSPIYELSYLLVSLARYSPAWYRQHHTSAYNEFYKIYYILMSLIIVGCLLWKGKFNKLSRCQWRLLVGTVAISVVTGWKVRVWDDIGEGLWSASIVLEALSFLLTLPNLLIHWPRTPDCLFPTRPEKIPVSLPRYLTMMFTWRFLYLFHWANRYLYLQPGFLDKVAFPFGVLQALGMGSTVILAWVIYVKQRECWYIYVPQSAPEEKAGSVGFTQVDKVVSVSEKDEFEKAETVVSVPEKL